MATRLKNLRFNQAANLVDRPANPKAVVVLFKRDNSTTPTWLDQERAYFAKQVQDPPVSNPSGVQASIDAATPIAVATLSETPDLITALRVTLASSYHLYIAAHAAHWNVEGPLFPSWHAFFGEVYDDVFDAIDHFAEAMRQHAAYAPETFVELLDLAQATLVEKGVVRVGLLNARHLDVLKALKVAADAAGDDGLSNFCQDRLAVHLKWDWQIRMMEKSL